jgi:hypothetical protein
MQGGAGASRDIDTEHDARHHSFTLPVLKMDTYDAAAWNLALQFIDPLRVERPEIKWVSISASRS